MAVQVVVSEIISGTVEDVFSYTMDESVTTEWQGGLDESYTEGPEGVGALTTQVRRILGIKFESQLECIEYDPPYRAAFQVVKGAVPYTVIQTYEEVEGGTRLTFEVEGEVVGPLKVLGEQAVVNQVRKDLEDSLANLKAIFGG